MLENLNNQNFDPDNYMEFLDEILDEKMLNIIDLKKRIRQIKK